MEVTSEELFKDRLKRLRLAAKLSQRQLAVPGVSYAYISRLEKGTRNASVRVIRKLAERLNVSPDYLETGIEPINYNEIISSLELQIVNQDNRIAALLENEVFRNTCYRYIFGCGCCFDSTEPLMKDINTPPMCPIHGEVAYTEFKASYSCGCYFRAKGVAPPTCPKHGAEMTTWSFGIGWENQGVIVNNRMETLNNVTSKKEESQEREKTSNAT